MPRAIVVPLCVVLSVCLAATSCTTHRPVAAATQDRPIHRIRLADDLVVTIHPPQTARWEGDSIVVRDGNGAVINSFARDEVVEAAEREERAGGVVIGALLLIGVLVVLLANSLSGSAY